MEKELRRMVGQKKLLERKKIWYILGLLLLAVLLVVIRGIGVNSRVLSVEEANQYFLQYGQEWDRFPLWLYRMRELGWIIAGMLFAAGISVWILDVWSAGVTIFLLSICPNSGWVLLLVVAWTVAIGWVKMLSFTKRINPIVFVILFVFIDATALVVGVFGVWKEVETNREHQQKMAQTIEMIQATGEDGFLFNNEEYKELLSFYFKEYNVSWYGDVELEEIDAEYVYMIYEEGSWFSGNEVEKYGISYTDMGELWLEGAQKLRLLQVHWGAYGAQERTADSIERIMDIGADCALISMTEMGNFKEEYYDIFLASKMVNLMEVFQTGKQLVASAEMVLYSTESVQTLCLGVKPERMEHETWEDLRELVLGFPDVQFVVFLVNPDKEELLETAAAVEAWEDALRLGVDYLAEMDNVHLSYVGSEEWIFINGSNKTAENIYTDEMALYLTADALMNKLYGIDEENLEQIIEKQKDMLSDIREGVYDYKNIDEKTIFFIGDSVFGDKKGSFSVAGVVAELTGATTYNLGYGGMTASTRPNINSGAKGLVSGVITGDYAAYGLDQNDYFVAQAQKVKVDKTLDESADGKDLIFVLNFGLNDYFEGLPVGEIGEKDEETYLGAMEATIEALKERYPEAVFIVLGQNHVSAMEYGMEKRGPDKAILEDYRKAIKSLAKHMEIHYIDMNQKLGFTKQNVDGHLSDGVHPNHQTCFLYGKAIADYLEESVVAEEK